MDNYTVYFAALSALFAYFSWQRGGFAKESEIELQLENRFDNIYHHINTSYNYTTTEVSVTEPQFPTSLYKYIPFIEREGFADIRISFWSRKDELTFELPSTSEIVDYELFPPDTELRQIKQDQNENTSGDIFLRIHSMDDVVIFNATKVVLATIHELNTGTFDEEFRKQLNYLDS